MTADFDPSAPAAPSSGLFGLPTPPEEARVHVIPVEWDATASYRKGARHAPAAVLKASRQIDLYDLVTGRPYEAGLAMLASDAELAVMNRQASERADVILEAGGGTTARPELEHALERINELCAGMCDKVRARTAGALAAGRTPFVLGGDHSVAYGGIQAAARRFPGLGVLQIDAHADLREAYQGFTWSHASVMWNVLEHVTDVERLVAIGLRDLCAEEHLAIRASGGRVSALYDHEWAAARLAGRDLRALVQKAIEPLPGEIWVSFDVDGLDPALCPHTGTPVPGGLDWHGAMLVLGELARSERRIVGGDLCEISPGNRWSPDLDEDGWDAIVGARLLYRMIGFAVHSTSGETARSALPR